MDISIGIRFGSTGPVANHSCELLLVMDRRDIEPGQEWPTLLCIGHVATFARDNLVAFAASIPEHEIKLRRTEGPEVCADENPSERNSSTP